jgi:sugar-specific transcriptional regulator TrmB
MTTEERLHELSLTKSEIKIYLYLLEQGVSTPPQIAKGTGIARTNCYNILTSLKNHGLIQEQKRGQRQAYLASDPEALLRTIKKKEVIVTQLLPDLRALYATQKNKPKIQFYDGFDQVKEIYWQATKAQKILAIGSTKSLVERDAKFFLAFEKKLKENGTFLQDLISEPSQSIGTKETKQILQGLYDFRLLPKKYTDFPTDILVWEDCVALIILQDPVFGTVITNPLLAKTFLYLFEMIWERRN